MSPQRHADAADTDPASRASRQPDGRQQAITLLITPHAARRSSPQPSLQHGLRLSPEGLCMLGRPGARPAVIVHDVVDARRRGQVLHGRGRTSGSLSGAAEQTAGQEGERPVTQKKVCTGTATSDITVCSLRSDVPGPQRAWRHAASPRTARSKAHRPRLLVRLAAGGHERHDVQVADALGQEDLHRLLVRGAHDRRHRAARPARARAGARASRAAAPAPAAAGRAAAGSTRAEQTLANGAGRRAASLSATPRASCTRRAGRGGRGALRVRRPGSRARPGRTLS